MKGIARLIAFAVSAVLLAATTACHKKQAGGPQEHETCPEEMTDSPAVRPEEPEVSAGPEFPKAFGSWTRLEVPVQVSVTKPKKLGMSGRASMINGRELLISLRFLGFEVGQLYADTDSVFVVEKVHKWYVGESLARLSAGTGLTLADLQGYLLGRPLRAVPELGGVRTVYELNATTSMPEIVAFYRNGTPAAGIVYGAPATTPTGLTASSVSIAAIAGGHEINGGIDYRLSQAKWDSGGGSLGFRRPGNDYSRVELSRIIKSL
jgi:hypothetical protein